MRTRAFTKGLATTAVSALMVTGLGSAAFADSVAAQVGAGNVVLYSQFSDAVSLKNDGANNTVHLEAGAGSNISAITFQYKLPTGDWVDIATVNRNADGTFVHEWNASGIAGATGVVLRATGTPSGAGAVAVNDDSAALTISPAAGAVESVGLADGDTLRYFQQPYGAAGSATTAVVSGTTSATTGNVEVSWFDGAAQMGATNAPVAVATGATSGTFRGVLDITGYEFDANPTTPVNQIVVGAERGSDETEAYTLKRQVITTVTATADRTTVPTGSNATVTVTVVDADGAPIAGARVTSSTGGAAQFTDADGQATFTQGGGNAYYYADATGATGYSAVDGDVRSADVTVTAYNAQITSLAGTSADGAAFDLDENAAGDITVQVRDQQGADFATGVLPRTVRYYWTITPFDGSPEVRLPAADATPSYATSLTDASGNATVALPSGQKSGTYALFASLEPVLGNGAVANSKVLEVKAGQAEVSYAQTPQSAPAGDEVTVAGKLALEDGTGLAKRQVQLDYTPGSEGSDTTPDAGIKPATGTGLLTTRTVETGADGAFSVVVDDPAETPQGTELGGNLAATPQGNAGAPNATHRVDFVSSSAPAGSTVEITVDTATLTPGEAVTGTAKVTAPGATAGAARVDVPGQIVTLTVDEGFFTDGTPAATPVVGQDAGALKDQGTEITAVTDDDGEVTFQLGMGRNEGFDDDGKVEATVTATAGTAAGAPSDTEDYDWSSANPLNGGDVTVEFAPDARQESGVLPKAPLTDEVWFDVVTTDQFGNRVGGAPVETPAGTVQSDFADDGEFSVSSDEAGDEDVTVTWDASTLTYSSVGGATTPGSESLTGSETVEWYAIDRAASEYTISASGADKQPVGSTVTVTYQAVDQFGEPVADLDVSFFRTGPDDQQDGEGKPALRTGQDGEVNYVFQGTREGTAQIAAVARVAGELVAPAQQATTVEFGAVKVAINAKINVKSKKKVDVVKVNAPTVARGAKVTLYKMVNGVPKKLASARLNAKGDRTFRVKDTNKVVTQYVAVVSEGPATLADATPIKGVK